MLIFTPKLSNYVLAATELSFYRIGSRIILALMCNWKQTATANIKETVSHLLLDEVMKSVSISNKTHLHFWFILFLLLK